MTTSKTVSRRGRPSAAQSEARQQHYLDVALTTFIENGYERTTLDQIARLARAGKITFYKRFGNKDELFRRVITEAIEQARAPLDTPIDNSLAPRDSLRRVIGLIYEAFTHPLLLSVRRLVVAEYQRFPELARELRSHNRELLSSLERYLTEANDRGDLHIPDIHAAALQLTTVASGGMRFLISEPLSDRKRKDYWLDSVTEFAWNSWRPR